MKKKILLMMSFVGLTSAWQLSQIKQVEAEDTKVKVMTTFYPVYEFTKGIVGNDGDVSMLMKAGTEPHDFEPTTKDVKKIQDSDVIVYMDDNMETWIPKVKKSIKSDKVDYIEGTGSMILAAGSGEEHHHEHEDSKKSHDHHDEEGHSHKFDPHVWLSPYRSITVVENIRDSLSKKYPKKADVFKSNAAAYIEKLKKLDKEYSDALSSAKQKSFVTQHAAFGYMALDYGLNQIAINGVSPENEPSAKRLAELSKYVKKYDIKYIYFEENASSKVAKTLAKEAGVKSVVLSPLESLTKKEIKAGEDYFSVMRENLKALELTTKRDGKEIKPEEDKSKSVYNGYFKDSAVKDRKLSDWSGSWQSVYPYLQDGTLDQVMDYKAKKSKGKMTAKEYKDYYEAGYKTDVTAIKINGKKSTITFERGNDKKTFTYSYSGKKIITYEKGNRGVRYMFEAKEKDAGEFKYIQFSDHEIAPNKAEHFHLYWGAQGHDEIASKWDHWPTYYKSDLSGREIAQEINAH